MMRVTAGMFLLASAMLNGCAATVPTSVAPPPENLHMTIMPGADHGEKRITFRTEARVAEEPTEENKSTPVSIEEDIDPFELMDTAAEPTAMQVISMDEINPERPELEPVSAINEETNGEVLKAGKIQ